MKDEDFLQLKESLEGLKYFLVCLDYSNCANLKKKIFSKKMGFIKSFKVVQLCEIKSPTNDF